MRNKRAEQIAAKRKHKQQLKTNRRSEPSFERSVDELSQKPTILIVCEGENTEPSYFNQFRLSSATIKSIGEGYNTKYLVNRAKQISSKGQYDQVWCVFDKDDFSDQDYNEAIQMAEANGFGVAYSNQAFEYWLILHFDDHQGGKMHRQDYNDKINKLLQPYNISYDGTQSKIVEERLFELLEGVDERVGNKRVNLAIIRAERNYSESQHKSPAKNESSTTVFMLVKELLKYV